MATAQDIIDSARYDLTDYEDGVGVGIEYDDAELLNHLNRMVGLLDSTLSALRSDLVEDKEESIDTVTGQEYVDISNLNSGNWQRLRSVWLGSTRLEKVTLDYMRYTSQFRSGNARPTIWTLWHNYILFPQGCDDDHTDLVIYYDKKTATLTLSTSMPYTDRFNEFLREMLVLSAKMKKNGSASQGDSFFQQQFRARMMREEIQRGYVPRPYNYKEF